MKNFDDALACFRTAAALSGRETAAEKKIALWNAAAPAEKKTKQSVLFLIAHEPLVAASRESFIGSLIEEAGGLSAVDGTESLYPVLSKEFVARTNPDIVITVAPEGPFDLKKKFSRFGSLSFMKTDAIFPLDADTACLYDPADMHATREQIRMLISRERNKP